MNIISILNFRSCFPFYIIFILCLVACNDTPVSIENTLVNAGDNKKELIKAIKHYKRTGEKKKLQALYFLIENMPLHSHKTGKGAIAYNALFNQLATTPLARKEYLNVIWDSITRKEPIKFANHVVDQNDIISIRADFLIEHIDAAFNARTYTWARNLSEKDFYRYILPYKLVEEVPELWNKKIQIKYRHFQEKSSRVTDPYDACLMINAELKKKFKIRSIPSYWDLTYRQLESIGSGKCFQATQYTAYIMRSFGLPIAMDFTPYWGNMNGGHEWNALIWNGKPVPFVGSESDPGKTKIDLAMQRKRSKVFRRTFAVQKDGLHYLSQGTEEIPKLFKDYYFEDVTREYIPVSDVDVKLNSKNIQFKYVFLCVFNRQKWAPIFWAKNDNGRATFKDMGRGISYLPVYYSGGVLLPAGMPLFLNQDGSVTQLKQDLSFNESIILRKKGPQGPSIIACHTYELHQWNDGWHMLEKKEATADSLVFLNVSKNSLLWLKSSDKSSNERIFVYKKSQQLWW